MTTVKIIINNKVHRFKHCLNKKLTINDMVTLLEKVKTLLKKETVDNHIVINQFYCKDLEKYKNKLPVNNFVRFYIYRCNGCNSVLFDYTVYKNKGYTWDNVEDTRYCESCDDSDNELLRLNLNISK